VRLFADHLAFVDLETTGTRAAADRITEVGIVRVDADPAGGPPRVDAWSSLVDPETPIPPAIQALTGITDAMVRGAPTFSTVAREIAALLDGCVFVAHNARFDYGFLKQAFGRLQRPFRAPVMCTVRLSRRLFPNADGHGLDAVVARHGIEIANRHRALGDAQAAWAFVQALYATLAASDIDAAARRILKIPSLPPQLPPDSLDRIPEAPGVYRFYGDNPLPLYIGKSVDLRERVAAHFSGDWRNETDLRLSAEIRRIEFEETAGELGALIRESTLIKALLPAHNRALRRKCDAGVLRLHDDCAPSWLPAAAVETDRLIGGYGPFASRRSARETLRALAGDHRLCLTRLGFERRTGPCFARQLGRCAGACVGAETSADHDARLRDALATFAIPVWPFASAALIREATVSRTDVHVARDWCWLGTARDESELAELLTAPQRPAFDADVTKLLLRTWKRSPGAFVAAPRSADETVERLH